MQSARGHSIGEGLQGFARAVLAGGVPCLLAPKWNTSIEESTVLMMRVYAFMASDKVGERRRKGGTVDIWVIYCDM